MTDLLYGVVVGTLMFWLLLIGWNKYTWRRLNEASWTIGIIVGVFLLFPLIDFFRGISDSSDLIDFYTYPMIIGVISSSIISYIIHIVFVRENSKSK